MAGDFFECPVPAGHFRKFPAQAGISGSGGDFPEMSGRCGDFQNFPAPAEFFGNFLEFSQIENLARLQVSPDWKSCQIGNLSRLKV